MPDPGMVTVQATDPRYYGIKHLPEGTPISADGTAVWPADQFTFALVREGTVRLVDAGTPIPPPIPVLPSDLIGRTRSGVAGGFTAADLLAFVQPAITSLPGLTTPLSQAQGGLGNGNGDASALTATARGALVAKPIAEWLGAAGSVYGALFGITGNPAIDDTNAFEAFLNYLATNGGRGVLPPGQINLTRALSCTTNKPFVLVGPGRDLCKVKRNAAIGTPVSFTGSSSIVFEGVEFDGGFSEFAGSASHGLSFFQCSYVRFRSCRIKNYKNSPFLICASGLGYGDITYDDLEVDGGGVANNGAYVDWMERATMRGLRVVGCPGNPGYGIQAKDGTRYFSASDSFVESCTVGVAFGQGSGTGGFMARVSGVTIVGCGTGVIAGYVQTAQLSNLMINMLSQGFEGIRLQNSRGITGKAITISNVAAGRYALRFDDCTDCVIEIELLDNVPDVPIAFTGTSTNNKVFIRKIAGSSVTTLFTDTSSNAGTNTVTLGQGTTAAEIADATTTGRAVLTATNAAAGATALGLGTGNAPKWLEAIVDGVAATYRYLTFSTAGVRRWRMYAGNNAETGSNIGSDWGLSRYSDAGAQLSEVLTFKRSTGNATFSNSVKPGVFTVATLPPATAGDMIYVSNACKVGEATGSGTGVLAYYSNGQWRRSSDDTAVVA